MWRMQMAFVILVSILACSHRAYSMQHGSRTFSEPSRRMSFEIPSGWQAQAGFGNQIADLSDGNGNHIRIISNAEGVRKLIATLYSGANIRKQDESTTLFETDAHDGLKGAVISARTHACDVHIICTSAESDFASTFLAAREISANMRCDLTPDPSTWDDDLKRVMDRAGFASLDGREGCPGIREESMRMALIAKQLGKPSDARNLERGRVEGSQSTSDFFSLLMRASHALDRGDIDKAEKMMRRVDETKANRSHLFIALKIRMACLERDMDYAEQLFEQLKGDMCGRSAAMAAYELGRATGEGDSGRAVALFEGAIEADPAFVPAYIALGQMLVDSDMPAAAVSARMNALLSKAPNVPEVQGFKRRFATVEKSAHP